MGDPVKCLLKYVASDDDVRDHVKDKLYYDRNLRKVKKDLQHDKKYRADDYAI
jgi:hypothetical protein